MALTSYRFLTEWSFAAPIDDVWREISRPDDWPLWWHGVLAVDDPRLTHVRALLARGTEAAARQATAAGETLLSFAHIERQARYDLADVATTAKKDGAGYVLNGEKSLAVHGDVADKLIVSGRVSGEQRAKNGSRPLHDTASPAYTVACASGVSARRSR